MKSRGALTGIANPSLSATTSFFFVSDSTILRSVSFTTSRLYEGRGSDPFEEITRIEEYYPTPVETAILRACQPEP